MLESDLRKIIDKTNKGITAESLNRKYNTKFMAGPNYTVIFKQDFISKDNINDDYHISYPR